MLRCLTLGPGSPGSVFVGLFVPVETTRSSAHEAQKDLKNVITSSNLECKRIGGDAACVAVVFEECGLEFGPMKNGSERSSFIVEEKLRPYALHTKWFEWSERPSKYDCQMPTILLGGSGN